MRIIAGSRKGHTIRCLKGIKVRPTLDRVREAVFNVIGIKIIDAKFLDLFAGTGAIGIEALSRGAQFCYFNDSYKSATQLIIKNLSNCRLEDSSKVFNMPVLKYIELLRADEGLKFDFVYVDPPYEEDLYNPVLEALSNIPAIIKTDSIVIVESNARLDLPNQINKLELIKKSVYSDTIIWYYQYI